MPVIGFPTFSGAQQRHFRFHSPRIGCLRLSVTFAKVGGAMLMLCAAPRFRCAAASRALVAATLAFGVAFVA